MPLLQYDTWADEKDDCIDIRDLLTNLKIRLQNQVPSMIQ